MLAKSSSTTLFNSDLTRKYYSINSQLSEPILEVYGNICVLQYCNAIWTSSDHIPSGFYPKILSGIWTPVSSSDDLNAANEYRLCIQSNGAVVLQKTELIFRITQVFVDRPYGLYDHIRCNTTLHS